jgi:hypothetical protein
MTGWRVIKSQTTTLVAGRRSVKEKEWLESLKVFGISTEDGKKILSRLGRTPEWTLFLRDSNKHTKAVHARANGKRDWCDHGGGWGGKERKLVEGAVGRQYSVVEKA